MEQAQRPHGKRWYRSITINANILSAIVAILTAVGLSPDPGLVQQIVETLNLNPKAGLTLTILFSIISIVGRVRATKTISFKKQF